MPRFHRRTLIRAGATLIVAFLTFRYVVAPFSVDGDSMTPTYRNGALIFTWRMPYTFSEPRRGDVVVIRMAGARVTLLKRIVALPGETIEFRNGVLFLNGRMFEEGYVAAPSDWEMEPRIVADGHYYVIGDNRESPMALHQFGEVSRDRIIGVPIW